jgi:hypothetical protein
MNTVTIHSKDFVVLDRPVVDCARVIGQEASRFLRSGAKVVVSVRGIRGVSSSFFNVILAAVADATAGVIDADRFVVETETETQRIVYERSLTALRESLKNRPEAS